MTTLFSTTDTGTKHIKSQENMHSEQKKNQGIYARIAQNA